MRKKLLAFFLVTCLFQANSFAASTALCYDTDTKIMLHMNGTDTSPTFTDSAATARTWTAGGDAQIDTAQSMFGGASGVFDGTGDSISAGSSTDFNIGTGDFTAEWRFRFNGAAAFRGWELGDYDTGNGLAMYYGGSVFQVYANTGAVIFSGGSIADTTWTHVALTRSGTSMKLFVNGTQYGSTATNSTNITTGTSGAKISRWTSYADSSFNGWVDEFRLVVGTAVWTSDFTPPTAEYTDCNAGTGNFFQLI